MQLRDILLVLLLLAVVGLGMNEAYKLGLQAGIVQGIRMVITAPQAPTPKGKDRQWATSWKNTGI